MRFISLACLVLVFVCQVSSFHVVSIPQKLHVSFYITSKCKDTINFITTQLYPSYRELKDYIDVEFIPWGKTMRVEDGSLQCQFGPDDCSANRIQSCVFHILGGGGFQEKMVEYANCEFKTLSSTSGDLHCANLVGVSDYSISQCTQSILADVLQQEAEAKTSRIGLTFVPTIVFQGLFDQATQDAAFKDFKGTVCTILQHTNPGACTGPFAYNDVIQ